MSTRCRLSVVIVRAAGGLLSRPIYPNKPVILSEAEGPASAFVVALAFLSVIPRAAEDLLLPLLAFLVCHSRRESAFPPLARPTKTDAPSFALLRRVGKNHLDSMPPFCRHRSRSGGSAMPPYLPKQTCPPERSRRTRVCFCCCACLSVCHTSRSGGPASSFACILGLSFPQGICFQTIRPADKGRMPHPRAVAKGGKESSRLDAAFLSVILRAAEGPLGRHIHPNKPVILSEAEGPASAFAVALAFLSVILRAAEDLLLPLLMDTRLSRGRPGLQPLPYRIEERLSRNFQQNTQQLFTSYKTTLRDLSAFWHHRFSLAEPAEVKL